MESLENFQKSKAVIVDFTSRTLAVIPSVFGRLYYVCTLKNPVTGKYEHDGLKEIYPENSVQEALAHCHAELFSRILETPLREQERDVRNSLETAGDELWSIVEAWRASRPYCAMCPEGMPTYLSELFSSNMDALLAIITAKRLN
ncbi:MAG: hypothetical protein LAO08_15615 [Acidobacteriia bacterium]|nr:hypothetical protein [Terriglobia bacterium]